VGRDRAGRRQPWEASKGGCRGAEPVAGAWRSAPASSDLPVAARDGWRSRRLFLSSSGATASASAARTPTPCLCSTNRPRHGRQTGSERRSVILTDQGLRLVSVHLSISVTVSEAGLGSVGPCTSTSEPQCPSLNRILVSAPSRFEVFQCSFKKKMKFQSFRGEHGCRARAHACLVHGLWTGSVSISSKKAAVSYSM
jgi:hypothetical protein